jgi:RNA 3'-terminal phosphate cyclase (ATP)
MSAITIDGSQGEGGGQILRTSLSLAAITGRELTVDNVRGGRAKPGLLRQHLTGLLAIAEITGGEVEGAELGSRRLVLRPGAVRAGEYRFSIGSAGSASLVLQTVLWPLLMADARSTVIVEGGTHNSMAPPFDFLKKTFAPVLARMGGHIDLSLPSYGFYPAGGGRIVCEIAPCPKLRPLELLEAGRVVSTRVRAVVSNLPVTTAMHQAESVRRKLELSAEAAESKVVISHGPGNVVMVELEHEHVTEVATAFGDKGKAAETAARQVTKDARRYQKLGAPVGEHLADQLIIPLALAGAGCFRTGPLSLHTRTNIDVVRAFLPVQMDVVHDGTGTVRVECRPE